MAAGGATGSFPSGARPVVVIDNYDSFVFNLARYIEELGVPTLVIRNDAIRLEELADLQPSAVVISPGPCSPAESGISVEVARASAGRWPLLGVCLGHQCLAAAWGTAIVRAPEPVHGRTSLIRHTGQGIWSGLPNPIRATRYHSLVVERESLANEFRVTAELDDGTVMAIEHRQWPLIGLQFHPESVLTEFGHELLARFLRIAGRECRMVGFREFKPLEDQLAVPPGSTPLHW